MIRSNIYVISKAALQRYNAIRGSKNANKIPMAILWDLDYAIVYDNETQTFDVHKDYLRGHTEQLGLPLSELSAWIKERVDHAEDH